MTGNCVSRSSVTDEFTPSALDFSSFTPLLTDYQYYQMCKAYSCLAFSPTAEIVWLQGKLHPPQWKCKATSDLANGTIPEYPTPFFIEFRAEIVLNRLTILFQCKVPKILSFARLRVALHFFRYDAVDGTTHDQ